MFTFSTSTSRPPQNLGLSRRVDISWDISWYSTVWYSGSSIDMHHGRCIWKINGGVTLIRLNIEGFWLLLSVWMHLKYVRLCVCPFLPSRLAVCVIHGTSKKREKILELEVPEIGGTPKSSIYKDGFSVINHPAMGVFPCNWFHLNCWRWLFDTKIGYPQSTSPGYHPVLASAYHH